MPTTKALPTLRHTVIRAKWAWPFESTNDELTLNREGWSTAHGRIIATMLPYIEDFTILAQPHLA